MRLLQVWKRGSANFKKPKLGDVGLRPVTRSRGVQDAMPCGSVRVQIQKITASQKQCRR